MSCCCSTVDRTGAAHRGVSWQRWLIQATKKKKENIQLAINELSNQGAISQHSFQITLQMLVSCRLYKVADVCRVLWGGEHMTPNPTVCFCTWIYSPVFLFDFFNWVYDNVLNFFFFKKSTKDIWEITYCMGVCLRASICVFMWCKRAPRRLFRKFSVYFQRCSCRGRIQIQQLKCWWQRRGWWQGEYSSQARE